jgi:SAM-dependent methyltransferase
MRSVIGKRRFAMNNTLTILSLLLLVLSSQPGVLKPAPLAAQEATWYPAVQFEEKPALDVPFVPTPYEVVNMMLDLAKVNNRDILYDLGCGDGRIVVTAAKERKVRRAVGVDLDPDRIRESVDNARQAGVSDRVAFHRKDLFDVDFREATVMTLYLLPSVNLKLRPKLLQELRPGTRIVSHDFDMGEWQPDRTVQAGGGHTVYFWVIPSNVNGTWTWKGPEGTGRRYELRLRQAFQNVDVAELTVDNAKTAVTNVKLTGDKLEFTIGQKVNGNDRALHFTGTVNEDSIQGSMAPAGVPGGGKKWNARRDPSTRLPLDPSNASHVRSTHGGRAFS